MKNLGKTLAFAGLLAISACNEPSQKVNHNKEFHLTITDKQGNIIEAFRIPKGKQEEKIAKYGVYEVYEPIELEDSSVHITIEEVK